MRPALKGEESRNGTTPRSDGAHGLQVVRILAAAQKSLELDGAPVPVKG